MPKCCEDSISHFLNDMAVIAFNRRNHNIFKSFYKIHQARHINPLGPISIHAKEYGKYRIIHIKEAVKKFLECGDYSKGIARIKCTNHNCDHEYFRPFSCKAWYLCPSCNQKRLLLFSEHLSENVLLKLPHRQFIFVILMRSCFGCFSNMTGTFSLTFQRSYSLL